MSLAPVPVFLLSIPVALVSTSLALTVWLLSPVMQAVLVRRQRATSTKAQP
jgi:hypothetical protein